MKILILDLKVSNLYSIINAVKYLGYDYTVGNTKKKLDNSDCIILPGVGSFPYAANQLLRRNLYDKIRNDSKKGKPILGICLGFQLLFSKGEEFKKTNGLDLVKGNVKIFPSNKNLAIPHVGWNQLIMTNNNQNKLIRNNENFYFVHSYYAKPTNQKIILSYTEYGNFKFCSSIHHENIFGFQFHPEKSGRSGLNLLRKTLKHAKKI